MRVSVGGRPSTASVIGSCPSSRSASEMASMSVFFFFFRLRFEARSAFAPGYSS